MANGPVKLADVIVPSKFAKYSQKLTEEKSALIQSGAMVVDPLIVQFLQGDGLTMDLPFFGDVANDAANVSTDDDSSLAVPKKIATLKETIVRLNRNQAWSSMSLVRDLIAADPLAAIGARTAAYWAREWQRTFLAVMKGVFADNTAAPSGTEHVAGDMTLSIAGSGSSSVSTQFSAEATIDALALMGDTSEDLKLVMMHSIVKARATKLDLIDTVKDSQGVTLFSTYLGRRIIEDDSMPSPSSGVYETYFFGEGALAYGMVPPPDAVETYRNPYMGTGGGQDVLFNRVKWCMHPHGFKYVGTSPNGGPGNAATSNEFGAAGSWMRVAPERKQVKIVRLLTREF